MKRLRLCLMCAPLLLPACQSAQEKTSLYSGELHCGIRTEESQSPFPLALRFVQDVAEFIMNKNPDTFQGEYAPERFCFELIDEASINARANVVTKQISLSTGAIHAAKSELSIAEMVSHELAHVTLQHYGPLSFAAFQQLSQQVDDAPNLTQLRAAASDQMRAMLATSQAKRKYNTAIRSARDYSSVTATLVGRYFAAIDTLRANSHIDYYESQSYEIYDRIASEIKDELYLELSDALQAELRTTTLELEVAQTQLQQTMSHYQTLSDEIDRIAFEQFDHQEVANGREVEADEKGLRFFLRAGLQINEFTYFHQLRVTDSQDDRDDDSSAPLLYCLKQLRDARSLVPERGTLLHPLPCWRWFNLVVRNPLKYSDELRPMIESATSDSFPTSITLEVAKQNIGNPSEAGFTRPTDDEDQDLFSSELDRQSVCAEMGGVWLVYDDIGYCELPYDETLRD